MRELGRTYGVLLVCVLLHGTARADEGDSAADDAASEAVSTQEGNEIAGDIPPTGAIGIRASLLDSVFAKAAKGSKRARKITGATGIFGGATLLGLGSWRITEKEADNEFSRGLGVMFITLGTIDLTTGIIALRRYSHEEKRHEKWKKDRKDGTSEIELAKYEGAFEASTYMREAQRNLVRWNGLTHMLAGVLVMALTPIPDLDSRSRRTGYIIGGVFMFTGTLSFAVSFRDTPNEKAWDEYQRGTAKHGGTKPIWQMAPMISRNALGLSVAGNF